MLLSTHSLRRLCALWVVVCTPIWAAPLYVASSLGTPPPGFFVSDAFGINNNGAVVGVALGSLGSRGFLSQSGALSILNAGSNLSSGALDVNDAGQIVGYRAEQAITWVNGVVQALPTLPGGEAAPPSAINNVGNVVGKIGDRGVIYRPAGAGSIEVIPTVESVLEDLDINDSNQVAGTGVIGGDFRAFLYGNGTVQNLGVLPGGFFSEARALNNAGQVVGFSDTPMGFRGFLHSNGAMQMIAPVGDDFASEMYGINRQGIAIGVSRGFSGNRALLYENGQSYNLNARLRNSGWDLLEARAINDSGQIVGAGTYQGVTQAFLLTPSAVPEPQTAALVSVVVALMAMGHRWRRS